MFRLKQLSAIGSPENFLLAKSFYSVSKFSKNANSFKLDSSILLFLPHKSPLIKIVEGLRGLFEKQARFKNKKYRLKINVVIPLIPCKIRRIGRWDGKNLRKVDEISSTKARIESEEPRTRFALMKTEFSKLKTRFKEPVIEFEELKTRIEELIIEFKVLQTRLKESVIRFKELKTRFKEPVAEFKELVARLKVMQSLIAKPVS